MYARVLNKCRSMFLQKAVEQRKAENMTVWDEADSCLPSTEHWRPMWKGLPLCICCSPLGSGKVCTVAEGGSGGPWCVFICTLRYEAVEKPETRRTKQWQLLTHLKALAMKGHLVHINYPGSEMTKQRTQS